MSDFVDELVALCRIFGRFEREQVCGGSVTVQQCVVLQALLAGPSDVGALADSVFSSRSAMTRLLDGLVRRDWIQRERDTRDRRRVHVELTPEGRAEAERLRLLTAQTIAVVIGQIPEDKRGQVLESVRLVRQAMEAAEDAVAGCCG